MYSCLDSCLLLYKDYVWVSLGNEMKAKQCTGKAKQSKGCNNAGTSRLCCRCASMSVCIQCPSESSLESRLGHHLSSRPTSKAPLPLAVCCRCAGGVTVLLVAGGGVRTSESEGVPTCLSHDVWHRIYTQSWTKSMASQPELQACVHLFVSNAMQVHDQLAHDGSSSKPTVCDCQQSRSFSRQSPR